MNVKINGVDVNVNYKILAVDEAKGRLTVRYFNDDLPEGFVHAVDLPEHDGALAALDGEALDRHILGCGPMGEFSRKKAARPDLAYLRAMIQQDHVVPAAPKPASVSVPLVADGSKLERL